MSAHQPSKPPHDGGHFTSPCCDDLEVREEDTQPGPRLSEKDRERLRQKFGGKMPPPLEPEDLEIREEDTQPGKRSESYTKLLEQKYGRKAPPGNGPAKETD